MIKIVLTFLLVFAFFFFGILGLRELTGKQRWALTKIAVYSTICAVLAVLTLIFIVLLF